MTLRLSHRTARVVGGIGRTLIGLGVITLLFVAYQLWGTGIQQARSQNALGDEFAARLQAVESAGQGTTTSTTRPSSSSTTSSTTTTAPALEDLDPEILAALIPVEGEPVAQISIPSIGVEETVVFGVRTADLRKGPGVFPSNPMPGTAGNAAIAGHRTTWGQPFHDLDLVQPGDEIRVTTLQGEFTYVVDGHTNDDGAEVGHFIVPASGVHILDDFGDDRITLVACHPKLSSRNRIVVTGLLTRPPVEPPPTTTLPDDDDSLAPPDEPEEVDNWGDGLAGDHSALTPTLLWSTLFALALLAVILVGHWWKRWPVYLVGSPLLAWLLWTSFVYLDQLLPSY